MQEHKWECANCGHGYDLGAIEAQLLGAVRRRARAYQTQDLRCQKCKQARSPWPAAGLAACGVSRPRVRITDA